MKITDDIIRDLLPLYADNAVSADTRQLVEEYLQEHPELRAEMDKDSGVLVRSIARHASGTELESLNKAKRRLKMRAVWMGLGIFFCAGIFAFTFNDDKVTWIWSSFPIGSVIMGVLGFLSWLLYGMNRRGTSGIGI